ncbi:MAG: sugar lactone lactonase YvrE [Methylophagaceae bacterium]|jgi:sugar lactone lactonase YvrE
MKIIPIRLLSLLFILLPVLASADSPTLVPAWQTQTVFQQPESVVYDSQRDLLFVSNVNGAPNEVDGNGYISQLSVDGKLIEQHWLAGLDAPKGLAIVGDTLYVADINQLVVIDIKHKKITKRYPISDAKFLNDVAADTAGNIYVSDMLTDTIHRLAQGKFEVWLHDAALEYPNGLLVEDDKLIVASWGKMTDGFATDIAGHLKSIDIATKKIQSLGDKTPVGNLDGLEADGEGNYYVTDWMIGKLLHIAPDGISKTLISLKPGSADLTVLKEQKLIIIPIMLSNDIVAYRIK